MILILLCLSLTQLSYITTTWAQEINSSNQLVDNQFKDKQTSTQSNMAKRMADENVIYENLYLSYVHSHDLTPLYQNHERKSSALDFQSNPEYDFEHTSLLEVKNIKNNHSSPKWEFELLVAFRSLSNLRIKSPLQQRRTLEKSIAVRRLIKLAHDFIKYSNQAYKLVDLERAQVLLDSAIELLIQARYTLIKPKKMAVLYLRRGVVAVEQKQFLLAAMNFREALLLSPGVRLKKGFDSPATIEVFEQTLKQLQNLKPYELIKLAERREWKEERQISLIVIKLKNSFFASVWQTSKSKKLSVESSFAKNMLVREELTLNKSESLNEGMKRLATKIWAILPFKLQKKSVNSSVPWQIMSGWGLSTLLKSPVSTVAFPGMVFEVDVQAFRQLQLKWGGSFSNSIQDSARDLRESFGMANAYFGPFWSRVKTHWWISLGFMIEWTYLGSTKITRSVGCKFFDSEASVPLEICNPNRDVRVIPSSWRLGPRLQMSLGLQLVRPLSIALQLNTSGSVYEQNKHPFAWPVGGSILIGYSFNSK